MSAEDDLQDFKDDLDSIRGGSDELADAARKSDRYESTSSVGKNDVIDLGLGGDDDSEDGPWLANFKKAVYVVVALAMFQAVVGPIPIPDATLLYVFAFGFLILGLWAGAKKHEELAAVWDRIREWREE